MSDWQPATCPTCGGACEAKGQRDGHFAWYICRQPTEAPDLRAENQRLLAIVEGAARWMCVGTALGEFHCGKCHTCKARALLKTEGESDGRTQG